MIDTQLTIRPLEARDLPQVVEIFCKQFPSLSWTRLGRGFIGKFIHWHYQYHPELALVADNGNQLIGFIIGAIGGHREYYSQVVHYAFPEFLTGSILHPWLFLKRNTMAQWADLLKRSSSNRANREIYRTSKTGEKKAIISFVAVTEASQGKGIGANLMQAFEETTFQTGVEVLSSYTEINNYAARRLHEKCGWKLVREDTRHKMVYYSKRLEKVS